MRSFLNPLLQSGDERHVLIDTSTDRVIAEDLLTAFNSAARNKGLLGRSSLADGSAMIIAPCSAVHTFFMQFPIDIAFIARDGRILKIRHDVRPWRVAVAFGAHAVVELPAGTLRRVNMVAGTTLAVRPSSAHPLDRR